MKTAGRSTTIIIGGGHSKKTARIVAIYQGQTLNKPALLEMFKQIIANNRAGGWRKLKSQAQQEGSPKRFP